MGKSTYKKQLSGSLKWFRDDLIVRQYICLQDSHEKWIKRHLNRNQRRKENQSVKGLEREYCHK